MSPSDPTGSLDDFLRKIFIWKWLKSTMAKNPKIGNAAVLIDAGYLSHISKHLGNGKYLKYNPKMLAMNLCRRVNLWCEDIYYYTCPPETFFIWHKDVFEIQ